MKILFICALPVESNGVESILGHPVVHTGVGKINSGYKTALAINQYKPDLVINFGSCGSFSLDKGTLVKVRFVYNGDMDAEPLSPYSVTPFDDYGTNFKLSDDGVDCFTSETFITKEKIVNFTSNKLKLFNTCKIFEMELYSVTKVCTELRIPIIAYKWVSDDGGVDDWTKNCQIGFKKFTQQLSVDMKQLTNQ